MNVRKILRVNLEEKARVDLTEELENAFSAGNEEEMLRVLNESLQSTAYSQVFLELLVEMLKCELISVEVSHALCHLIRKICSNHQLAEYFCSKGVFAECCKPLQMKAIELVRAGVSLVEVKDGTVTEKEMPFETKDLCQLAAKAETDYDVKQSMKLLKDTLYYRDVSPQAFLQVWTVLEKLCTLYPNESVLKTASWILYKVMCCYDISDQLFVQDTTIIDLLISYIRDEADLTKSKPYFEPFLKLCAHTMHISRKQAAVAKKIQEMDYENLIELVDNEDEKTAISALDTISELLSFESLGRQVPLSIAPMHMLIKECNIPERFITWLDDAPFRKKVGIARIIHKLMEDDSLNCYTAAMKHDYLGHLLDLGDDFSDLFAETLLQMYQAAEDLNETDLFLQIISESSIPEMLKQRDADDLLEKLGLI